MRRARSLAQMAYRRTGIRMISLSKAKPRFLLGLFLICMCCLMLQIIETRVLSVISYYHLAFFAISMAMFGMTAGSLIVYFNQALFVPARLLVHLSWIASAFAVTAVLSIVILISPLLLDPSTA